MENFVLYGEICVCEEQQIYKARRKGTINFLAISCIDKKRRVHVTNHVRFARALEHESILKFHEWYETGNHLWVVMDLCTGGTLEMMLQQDRIFPESAIIEIGQQLLNGLQFIHSTGVIFADWFPARIFLDGCGNVKYFDFSYARMEGERLVDIFPVSKCKDSECDGLSKSALPYTAPEILRGAPASKASDIWGLGCIFFRMFFAVTPFASQAPSHVIQRICTHELEIPIQCNHKPSTDLWSLLSAMLTKDPNKRILLKDVLAHQFLHLKPVVERDSHKICTFNNPDCLNNSLKQNFDTVSTVHNNTNGVADMNDQEKVALRGAVKNLKRSVSMGDSALVSAALLRNKTLHKQTVSLRNEGNKTSNGSTSKAESYSQLPLSIDQSAPVGEANFELYARACPPVMKPTVFETHNSNASLTTLIGTEDSEDISCHSNLRTIVTPDCKKKFFFESNDNLQPPITSLTEERMTKSEYAVRNEDTSIQVGSVGPHRTHLSARIASLVSPQTRARLALIYPWGDEVCNLPQKTGLVIGRDSSEFEKLCSSDVLEEFDFLWEMDENDPSGHGHSLYYIPQPIGDYYKWVSNPPKSDLQLPCGLVVFSPSTIRSITEEELNDYSCELLNRMVDSLVLQESENCSNFLSYVAWFLAITTLESKQDKSETDAEKSILTIRYYLPVLSSLLPLTKLSASAKTWLCRIGGLLIYRTSCLIQQGEGGQSRQLVHGLIAEVAPKLPSILSSVVDILRDKAFKDVSSLKKAGLIILGELLICEMCLYGHVLANPLVYVDLTFKDIEVSEAQWQSALLRIILSLSSSTSRGGNTAQRTNHTKNTYCATQTKPLERGNLSHSTSVKSSSPTTIENKIRLTAARALNETIVAVLGCQLMRLLQHLDIQEVDGDQSSVKLAISLSSSVKSFLNCLLTPENTSRIWTDGVKGGISGGIGTTKTKTPKTALVNLSPQYIDHACASALAGLIRLKPSLFVCGLIDRSGTSEFIHKINPSIGTKGQSTVVLTCLLSAMTTGLLLPLALTSKPLGSSLRAGMKSGTPAACRRLLNINNNSFLDSILSQLKSPYIMRRAKAYLMVAAALDLGFGDILVSACEACLPSCLERDLKMTNQHYLPSTVLNVDDVLTSGDEGNESENHTQEISYLSPDLRYLGLCVKHLSDLIVYSLVPNICHQVATAIGVYAAARNGSQKNKKSATTASTKSTSKISSSIYQDRSKRTISSAGVSRYSPMLQGSRHSPATTTLGVSLKTGFSAFSCLPVILASSASIRNRLLLPPRDPNAECVHSFCLIQFLSQIISYWTSSMGNLSSTHRSGSLENQLLLVTLALVEDISRQLEVVESRREDLIKALLPAIAKLAVAPASDSMTRSICVRIILNMNTILCGGDDDCESMTSSNISLNLPIRSSGLTRAPFSVDRLNSKISAPSIPSGISRTPSLRCCVNQRPSSTSSVISSRSSSRTSIYRPNSFHEKSSSSVNSLKGYKFISNLKNTYNGPSPEVLDSVLAMVNNLLIPYASLLLDLRKPSPSPYFLRLLIDCLHILRFLNHYLSPKTLVRENTHSTFLTTWRVSNVIPCLTRFITNCNCGYHRFSVHCFLALRLLSILAAQWPQESGLMHLLLESTAEYSQNPVVVIYDLLVSIGSSILRHGRHSSTVDALNHPSKSLRPNIPDSSHRGYPILLRISADTTGVRHLLLTLKLLNTLLTLITDVVRYALHFRQNGPPADRLHYHSTIIDQLPKNSKDVCFIAERLLSSSRPPKHLPGILASLLEASSSEVVDNECVPDGVENGQEAVSSGTTSVAANLVGLAISTLASLASLYGGEYCRTALSAAGLRGFTTALRRSDKHSATRLLLRILRRLSESDEVCLRRMIGPAAKHLHSIIWKLRSTDNAVGGCENQDLVTVRLARALSDQLRPRPGTLLI